MVPVLSADPYSASDCGQPGSELYAQCQALFPHIVDTPAPDITTLGYIPGKPPLGPTGDWIYDPLAASPDGSWVAYGVYQADGRGSLELWHADEWQNTNVDGYYFSLTVKEITNSGLVLGGGGVCPTENGSGGQFVTTFGCIPPGLQPDIANKLADGGFGTLLAINEAGEIFQQGGKYAWTVLSPPGVRAPVPEPATWIILSGGIGMAISLRRLVMKLRRPRWSSGSRCLD